MEKSRTGCRTSGSPGPSQKSGHRQVRSLTLVGRMSVVQGDAICSQEETNTQPSRMLSLCSLISSGKGVLGRIGRKWEKELIFSSQGEACHPPVLGRGMAAEVTAVLGTLNQIIRTQRT